MPKFLLKNIFSIENTMQLSMKEIRKARLQIELL